MRDLDKILPFGWDLPDGWRIESHGDYWRIVNATVHPIAGYKGRIGLHRWVLYEHLHRPIASNCIWCGYSLPWVTRISPSYLHCINVDHLDSNKRNNEPDNLAPSCWWCNTNRSWAEIHEPFWSNWRKWMADVPPVFRPQLIRIAMDEGLVPTDFFKEKEQCEAVI